MGNRSAQRVLAERFRHRRRTIEEPAGGWRSRLLHYFDELLEWIRDIRASERRMYLRVKDILALAGDYLPSEPETQVFFKTIQNKLHFAATGKTAPELIAERADASQPNMGLAT